MNDIATLTAENASLKQQIEHMRAQMSLQQELVAAQKVALTARDGKLQALRALADLRAECGSAGATSGSVTASSLEEQRKRARVRDSSVRSPLDKDEILDEVFSYVGVGDYYFVAGVSRRWRGRYIKLCYNKAAGDQTDKLRTTYSSAFVTAARLQLAFRNGVEVEKLHDYDLLADNIARYSSDPIGALIVAKTYDMRYPDDLARAAAFNGRLQLLQWLHEHRCPWSDDVPICYGRLSQSAHL
eukprot:15720-Heterococcus_DN1.PRE.1